ncbi:MAG: hypothetical protein MJ107_04540 [Lachnospiraceae bacterium]|nr:hypothetical protein [Lachnospiraceae bacterium]
MEWFIILRWIIALMIIHISRGISADAEGHIRNYIEIKFESPFDFTHYIEDSIGWIPVEVTGRPIDGEQRINIKNKAFSAGIKLLRIV